MRRLFVMLPALDEADAVAQVISGVPVDLLRKAGYETSIVIVDGGSTDGTQEIAMRLGCEVIAQTSKGKGAGMRQGFKAFQSGDYDILVMLDVDGTYDPGEIPILLKSLEKHDLVIGDRLNGEMSEYAMTKMNWIGNHLLTWFAVSLYGVRINDLCTGYWAFTRKAIDRLQLNSMRFEIEAEMYTSAVRRKLSIGQVPISYKPRKGFAKLGSVRDGTSIARKLIIRRIFPVPIEEMNGGS